MIEIEILKNRNLLIKLVDKVELKNVIESQQSTFVSLYYLLEYSNYIGNGWYGGCGSDMGIMYDGDILVNDFDYKDNGEIVIYNQFWYFPYYATKHYSEQLLNDGEVTFLHSPVFY